MSKNNLSLQKAINAGLVSLGEPIMETINWHLNSRGFFIESNYIDITVFDYHLREIIGDVADNVLAVVYKTLEKQHSLYTGANSSHDRHDPSLESRNSKDESMVYKIQRLIAADTGAKEGLHQ